MEKQLIARGQATILVQKDSYTIHQSVSEYIFPANNNGALSQAVTFSSVIKVTLGDDNLTNFSIGTVTKPAGFSAITVNNANKTVTYSVAAGTTTMADSGLVTIPVVISSQTYQVTFSYAKAKTGAAGIDSNMLDWVSDWNSAKTVIGSQSVITPKLFAGVKNSNNTITGIAIGRFPLSTVNASGTVGTETINGIYGFKDGYKTFAIDTTGSVLLGKGNQFIRYNPANGKIEFGSEVTLNWVNAINAAKTEAINSAASTAQAKADAAKNAAIATAATDAAGKINAMEIGGDNHITNGDFRFYTTSPSIGWDNALNGSYVISNWGSGYNNGVSAPTTGYHAHLNTNKFGFPVLELVNKNSVINQLRRWLGIWSALSEKTKLVPGAKYTFSADLMADTAGAVIHGGIYSYKKGQANAAFSSGQYSLATAGINKWERVSYTFTLDNDIDLTKTVSFYIYGHNGTEGICWVKNVSLQKGTKGSWVRCSDDIAREVADAKQAGTDAKTVADAITNKASTEGWATKLTYIGSTGIFTGTLSANTVNAVRINASQITAGTIDAALINVSALKTSLITAGNIEALTLNVVRGKIGGWNIDADSIYRGIKSNAAGVYTGASGSVCIGSNGIRGFKWRLEIDGSGALAGGNISWDAAGNVTFGTSVALNWTNAATAAADNALDAAKSYANTKKTEAINSAATDATNKVNALQIGGRNFYKKSTSITNLINSPTVQKEESADSQNGFKLTGKENLTCAIRINKVITRNGSYVVSFWGKSNGTSAPNFNVCDIACSGNAQFTTSWKKFELKVNVNNYTDTVYHFLDIENLGWLYYWLKDFKIEEGAKATGWSPAPEDTDSSIKTVSDKADGTITALGGTSFPKLTHISGIGIYTGTLTATQVNAVAINAGNITTGTLSVDRIGAKAITAAKITAGTITAAEINVASIQASIVTATAVNGLTCTFNKGTIAGWQINASQIYKNSVYLGSDGSITNSTKWKFNYDGSGQVANGNISWNAAGAVTFSSAVSLNWTDAIEKIQIGGNNLLNNSGDWRAAGWNDGYTTNGGGYTIDSSVPFKGRPTLKTDAGNGVVHSSWIKLENNAEYTYSAMVRCNKTITGNGNVPLHYWAGKDNNSQSKITVLKYDTSVVADTWKRIYVVFKLNSDGDSFRPFLYRGSNESTYYNIAYFKLEKGNRPTDWSQSDSDANKLSIDAQNAANTIMTALGGSGYPKLTKISSTGIYTGTLTAAQVNAVTINAGSITAGTLSADRIAAGSITSTKLDAASIKANIINTGYINGLSCTFVQGTIGGWTINSTQIYKNRVYLDSDGSISNGTKWKLNNDGSGQIADGSITWNAAGTVTFASSVSLNWTNAATTALNSAKSYADAKKTEAINAAATDATTKTNAAKELALATAFGKMIYRDPEFRNGNNSISVYNNSGNGTVTITRTGLSSAPNDSKTILEIKTAGVASPNNGGFCFGTTCSNRKVFITKIIAKIPVGRNIQWASNSIGSSGSSKWLTSNAGTGDWQEYVYKVTCGTDNFSSTNYFYLDGTQGTAASPVTWQVAYATVFDTTSSEKYTTTIDANGVYTGTIRAGQVLIDSTLVVGGSSYNGSISVRDAGNNIMATLDRSGITALAGQIGGWNIKTGSIYACAPAGGHRVFITASGYIYNDDGTQDYWGLRADGSATFGYGRILFDNDGSGYVANQNIKWDAKGNVEVKGNITANSGLIAGFTISGNKLVNTAADSSIEFSSMMGNASMTINSYSSLLSLRADSARKGIFIQTYATGAVGLSIIANAGSTYAIESYGPTQLGQRAGERWCVPGVLYAGCKYSAGNGTGFSKIWGEGCNITSCSHLGSSRYKFYHNLGHTEYTVFGQVWQDQGYYGSFRLLERATNYFVLQNLGSSGKPDVAPFDFIVFGRNKWY